MGVSIHYKGTLADKAQRAALCDELTDIAETMGWKHHAIEDEPDKPVDAQLVHENGRATITGTLGLQGVSFRPHPKCENVSFYFDRAGRLRSLLSPILTCEDAPGPEVLWVFVKTQSATPDTHIAIVKLLRYIKERYIHDLAVSDEGAYWETGDADLLATKMQFIADRISDLANALENTKATPEQRASPQTLADKLEAIIRRLWDKGKGAGNA